MFQFRNKIVFWGGDLRIVVGVTGASGVIYALRLLQKLRRPEVEVHLILSRSGEKTLFLETGKLAADMNIPVKESAIPREMLYIADEVFFVGTAVEVTPIRSVDKIVVGKGTAGPITRQIQQEFFALTSGKKADRHGWLTPVNAPVAAGR